MSSKTVLIGSESLGQGDEQRGQQQGENRSWALEHGGDSKRDDATGCARPVPCLTHDFN